jgi:hypothetical protein
MSYAVTLEREECRPMPVLSCEYGIYPNQVQVAGMFSSYLWPLTGEALADHHLETE